MRIKNVGGERIVEMEGRGERREDGGERGGRGKREKMEGEENKRIRKGGVGGV